MDLDLFVSQKKSVLMRKIANGADIEERRPMELHPEDETRLKGLTTITITPLIYFILIHDYEAVGILLDKGANPNMGSGKSPLSHALCQPDCLEGRQLIQSLIESGAQIEGTTDDVVTPLIWAIYYSNFSGVKMLLEAGVAICQQIEQIRGLEWGWTGSGDRWLISWATHIGTDSRIVELLSISD